MSTETNKIASMLVIGVGTSGGKAIHYMMTQNRKGINFVVINADQQRFSPLPTLTSLSISLPEDAPSSASEQHKAKLQELLHGIDIVCIVGGMGGRTGTHTALMVAQMAKAYGALLVGFVTRPFDFEGVERSQCAEEGIQQLTPYVDTLITIPNQRLYTPEVEALSPEEGFRKSNTALYLAIESIIDIQRSVQWTVDLNDVHTYMKNGGLGLFGYGYARGEDSLMDAMHKSMQSVLLDATPITKATSVLVAMTTSPDISFFDVHQVMNLMSEDFHDDAYVIFGWVVDENLIGSKVRFIATKMDLP